MMSSKQKVLLIFPPIFYPHMPYLATASLYSFMKNIGFEVSQSDLNIDFYNHVLMKKNVINSHKRIVDDILPKFKERLPEELQLTSDSSIRKIIELIDEAILTIKGKSKKLEITEAKLILDLSLDVVSDSYYPLKLFTTNLKTSYNEKSSSDIYKSLFDTKENIFIDYYNEVVPDLLRERRPDFIGISITAHTQLIPVFTLCKKIRETNKSIKIILGGNVVTRLSEFFSNKNKLSEFYDYIITGEGENKLIDLIKKENKQYIYPTNVNNIPTPNFDDLPIYDYFDFEPILPIYASRKCYWDKCTFCDIPFGYDSVHRQRSVENIINDIITLKNKYSVNNFKFVDDAMPPKIMYNLSVELIKREIEINWEAYVILAKEFLDKEFCVTISEAGCQWLYFGFESGDPEVTKGMKKGHKVLNIEKILKNTHEAGINNHVWVIIGFPGEKKSTIQNTIDFIDRNHTYIDSIEVNQFALVKHASIMKNKNWLDYNIEPIFKPEEDLALLYDYKTLDDSITQQEAAEIVDKLREYVTSKYSFSNVVRSSNLVGKHKSKITKEVRYEMVDSHT